MVSSLLISLIPLGASACSGDQLESRGQLITCETDPDTGVILRCTPGDSGGSGTCTDIDEDGDGEPHDETDDNGTDAPTFTGRPDSDGDDDGDGIPDSEDCDHHPGEDADDGHGDLPYDVRPGLGTTTAPVLDAFAESGAQPAAILSVTGATWRAAELAAGTAFVVTRDDCDHAGNRDVGRDRVVVTWRNSDGSTGADHLDIRYCK